MTVILKITLIFHFDSKFAQNHMYVWK